MSEKYVGTIDSSSSKEYLTSYLSLFTPFIIYDLVKCVNPRFLENLPKLKFDLVAMTDINDGKQKVL